MVTVTGPKHHVEQIDAATTDPVDATGTMGSAVFTTNVYVSDPLVQVAQATVVRVTVIVQKVGAHRTLSPHCIASSSGPFSDEARAPSGDKSVLALRLISSVLIFMSCPTSFPMSQQRQLFGTDGIRGVAGEFPLTKQSTYLIGRALGHDLVPPIRRPRP